MKKRKFYRLSIAYLLVNLSLAGCTHVPPDALPKANTVGTAETVASAEPSAQSEASSFPVPAADGKAEIHNRDASIDYSHTSDGYVMVSYTGDCPKVKLRITGPDDVTYTYDLHGNGYETFPLSAGDGDYDVTVYENIIGNNYATCLYQQLNVQLENEFVPFLYPNQYVNFTPECRTVAKASELAQDASSDLEIVSNVYNYIISSITYDYEKASDPPIGYLPNVDEILASGTGICLDYAAVMASMLRSRQIPTRLEIGYAQDDYHAWISIYTEETGWLNKIIEFKGDCWTLIDPTFGASTDAETLQKFISDDSNYILQKMY